MKLLKDEAGSDEAIDLWEGSVAVITSRLTYVETRSALASAVRGGGLSPDGYGVARTELERLWRSVSPVALTRAAAVLAGDVSERTGLRSGDAVQLATALQAADPDLVFVCWDRALSRAAAAVGFPVVPSG